MRLIDQKDAPQHLPRGRQDLHTNRGGMAHDDLIGREEGFTITSSSGGEYLVFRPLLSEFVVSMPRGAAVVYPTAQIVSMATSSPARTWSRPAPDPCADLLPAAGGGPGTEGDVVRASRGVRGRGPPERHAVLRRRAPRLGAQAGRPGRGPVESGDHADRVILDMLAPWDVWTRPPGPCVPGGSCARTSPPPRSSRVSSRPCACTAGSPSRSPGSRSCATGTSRGSRSARAQDDRPHGVPGHRAADGSRPASPLKKRRPAPGAYGPTTPAPAHPSPDRRGRMIINPLPNRDKHPHIWDRDATSRG